MKKTTIVITSIIGIGSLLAQPGKPRGPGGQYSERMEMMMIWKLTDHLELTGHTKNRFLKFEKKKKNFLRRCIKKW